MYRLAGMQNRTIQKVVTQELIRAFYSVFDIDIRTNEITKEAFEEFMNIMDMEDTFAEDTYEFVRKKYNLMLQELLDPRKEYTLDPYGEFLLIKVLEYTHNVWKELEKEELYWESSASEEEISLIDSFLLEELHAFKEEVKTDFDEKDQMEKLRNRFIKAPYFFYEVDYEDDCALYIPLLFWDHDGFVVPFLDQEQLERFLEIKSVIAEYLDISTEYGDYGFVLKEPCSGLAV